jgi:phosphonate transport system substrate-binding protein
MKEAEYRYHSQRKPSPLRFATFLSPSLYEVYEDIGRYVGEQMGHPTQLRVGQSLDEFADGKAHIGFVCGLPYSQTARRDEPAIELVAAPILSPKRYQGKPIYFSDIVVRRDSPFASFDDLQKCTWGYNENTSHSGWNIVCYSLLVRGKALDYFGKLVKTGSHLRSLEMIQQGNIDAAAIDSHVLDVLRVSDASLGTRLRVIDTLGPSSIPPVVVSKSLSASLKHEIEHVLLSMHHHPRAAQALQRGLIKKFVSVTDDHYRPIHDMFTLVEGWAADGHGRDGALMRLRATPPR